MITQVSMKNWRTHLDSKISFSGGTNIIVGNVGTGKSSLLDAICFALFGTFPNLQSKKIKIDDIIMRRPSEKSKAEIEVGFSIGGKSYSVKRVVEKGRRTTYSDVRENGRLLETNSSRVTEVVEDILKTNYETFSKAIYSEQNNMDYFLTLGKGQRTKKLDELLMIDKFESARAGCVSAYNKIGDRKSVMQTMLDQMKVEDVEERIRELKDSIKNLQEEKKVISERLEGISDERHRLEKEIGDVSEVSESVEKLKKDRSVLDELLKDVSDAAKAMENELSGQKQVEQGHVKKVKSVISELEVRIKEYGPACERLVASLADNKSRCAALEEGITDLSGEIKQRVAAKEELDSCNRTLGRDVEREIEKNGELLKKTVYEIESVKSRIRESESAVAQLSQAESKCPVCESRLDSDAKKSLIKDRKDGLEKLSERLPKLESEKRSVEGRMKELNASWKKMQQLEMRVGDLDKLEKQLADKKSQLREAKEAAGHDAKSLKDIELDLGALNERLESNRKELEETERIYLRFQELDSNRSKESEISNRLEKVIEKLSTEEAKLKGRKLDSLKDRLNEALIKEAGDRQEMSSLERMLKEKAPELDKAFGIEQRWKSIREKIRHMEKIVQELKVFEKAVTDTQIELRKQFIETVNYTMNQLWGTLYPYGDFTEIKLHVEEGDYVLKLLSKSGVWSNADGGVSGGERSIACLALRVAFAMVLAPNIRILLLDEPSHNMDSNAVSQLAAVLRERMGEFVEQTILITHQQELEEAVTGMAYRLERDKANDDVTRIVQLQ